MSDTVRATDFSIDDLTVDRLQELLRDVNAFPRTISYISIPRATMVRMIEMVIQHRRPKILL